MTSLKHSERNVDNFAQFLTEKRGLKTFQVKINLEAF